MAAQQQPLSSQTSGRSNARSDVQVALDQLSYIHPRKPGSKVHFCSSCVFPIAQYGRLLPCMHAFCLSCATDMATCYICGASIARIERVAHTAGLHISAATLQSFRTAEELAKHTRQVQTHLSKHTPVGVPTQPAAAARQHQQQQQQVARQPQQQQQHQQQQARPQPAAGQQ